MRWEMRIVIGSIAATFIVAAAGCITVNINFPAKEVDRAAEVIVGEARPVQDGNDGGTGGSERAGADGTEGGGGMATPPPAPEAAPAPVQKGAGDGAPPSGAFGPAAMIAAALLAAPAEPAGREPEIKINIDTPEIKAIRESLVKRFGKLRPFYEKGAIGENREGYIEGRGEEGLSLKEKRDLKGLIGAENDDRRNLYRAIVKANELGEENLKRVQARFAKNWIEKSRPGWWIQGEDGKWAKKPDPKKAGKKEGKGNG